MYLEREDSDSHVVNIKISVLDHDAVQTYL